MEWSYVYVVAPFIRVSLIEKVLKEMLISLN